MHRDQKPIYIISAVTFAALFALLFVDLGSSRIAAACLLLPLTLVTCLVIKKRTSYSINKRQVLLLMSVIGALYVILVQMSGAIFGYYQNPYYGVPKYLLTHVLPLTAVIITIEIIRSVMLAQKNKFATVMCFASCVTAELLMQSNIYGITNFNYFMDFVGMTLFPALTANLLYHYMSKRYGPLPGIAYRLLLTLYIYFVPAETKMSDAITALILLILPLVLMAFLSALYQKQKKTPKERKKGALSTVCTVAAFLVMLSIVMLISCQFRFGALVIATDSMTGEINKGDMIIYERYEDQPIREGQIIVFSRDGNRIVHRVVEIENRGDGVRYYTKGDANNALDIGYVTKSDIVGLTDMKVAYVGYPTLWLRDLILHQ